MRLMAIDPSLRATGWALFVDGELKTGGIVKTDPNEDAAKVAHVVAKHLSLELDSCHAVIEKPQIYQGRKSKGNPNDLVGVALIAGACAAWAKTTVFITPHDWKGTIPKDILPRYIIHKRNEKELSPEACTVYRKCLASWAQGIRHNFVDAVGIGLYAIRQKLLYNSSEGC